MKFDEAGGCLGSTVFPVADWHLPYVRYTDVQGQGE